MQKQFEIFLSLLGNLMDNLVSDSRQGVDSLVGICFYLHILLTFHLKKKIASFQGEA